MRPRVECTSSWVAWKDGHMAPESERHAPTPTQRLMAWPNEPSSAENAWTGVSSNVRAPGPGRMPRSRGSGSTTTPGLKKLSGSKIRLNRAKAPCASSE